MYRWMGYVTQLGLSPGGTVVKCHVLVTVIRELGCSVRGTDLATGSLARRWVFFSWWRCSREVNLYRSWCIWAALEEGGAGSSSSLLWIVSKPQNWSKGLLQLRYSPCRQATSSPEEPWPAPNNSPLLWSFGLSLSCCCLSHLDCGFSLYGFDQGIHLACYGFPVWEK